MELVNASFAIISYVQKRKKKELIGDWWNLVFITESNVFTVELLGNSPALLAPQRVSPHHRKPRCAAGSNSTFAKAIREQRKALSAVLCLSPVEEMFSTSDKTVPLQHSRCSCHLLPACCCYHNCASAAAPTGFSSNNADWSGYTPTC